MPSQYKYQKKDFVINRIQKRKYGNQWLIYVNIKNLKTGTEFEDWVRPDQIKTVKDLNNLINWEVKTIKKKKKGKIANFKLNGYSIRGITKTKKDNKTVYQINEIWKPTKYGSERIEKYLTIEANNIEELKNKLINLLK